jgi:5-methylcytosine-specific restriction endonuclease McrA
MSTGAGDAFEFDINARRVQITDGELLDGLRRYAAAHGPGPFRCRDFRGWRERPFEPATAIHRFGSWRRALELIGIEGGRPRMHEPEELMANLEDVWRRMGRPPGVRQLRRRGKYCSQPYCRCWGSLRRACELLAAHKRGEMTREELLRAGPGRVGRKQVSLEVRWRVLRRDRYRCVVCGKSPALDGGVELEVDHIVPVARGGGNGEENLRTLCGACNRGKKDGAG